MSGDHNHTEIYMHQKRAEPAEEIIENLMVRPDWDGTFTAPDLPSL